MMVIIIILQVGIQYRVASLAFLYFDTEDVPGNAGYLYQLYGRVQKSVKMAPSSVWRVPSLQTYSVNSFFERNLWEYSHIGDPLTQVWEYRFSFTELFWQFLPFSIGLYS